MTKVVTDSNLDWTIARITNPTDKRTEDYVTGKVG